MFKWRKLGIVFDPTVISGRPWLKEFAQAPATLVFDDFVRVFFSCRPPADKDGKYVSYSAYVDLRSSNLMEVLRISEEPILDLGKRGTFDEFGTYPVSVIRDGRDVYAYYGGWTRLESVPFDVAIGIAKSMDSGNTFQRIGDGPILASSIQEPFILSGPKIRKFNNQWWLFYIAGTKWIANDGKPEPVYKIRVAFSQDGLNWRKVDKNLISNKLEEDEAQASPDVFFMNGRYHMFFCYRFSINYRGKEKGYRIGYAVSDDLVNWKREDEKAGIDISSSGWDDEMISYPHVLELNGEYFMFYLGNQVGRYGFGLAKMEAY
jgi:predicted GH43/DUF377 family glycosyl hydrolase